jgi:hypothetical protein
MFQYALGRKIADKYDSELYLDLSWFNENKDSTNRIFELDKFNVNFKISTDDIKKNVYLYRFRALNFISRKLLQKNIQHKNFFIENGLYYNEKIHKVSPHTYLVGYWQSEKYFSSETEIIVKHFTLRDSGVISQFDYLGDIKNRNSVSVHIRRTDFNQYGSIHGTLPLEYYKKAISIVLDSIDNPLFFVFSDDIEWTKTQFPNVSNFIFIDTGKSYLDLFLMSQCKNNIIANSSFSWWGAWLNQNVDKLVLAPRIWYLNNRELNEQTYDLIPKKWMKI